MNTVTTALSERLALALVTLEDTAACYDGDKAADLRAAARAYARVADEVDGACSIDALRAKLATAEKQRLDLDTLRARALTDDSHRMRPAPTAPRKAGGNTGGAGSSPAVGPTRQPREEAMSTRQVTVTYSGSTGLDIDEPGIVDDLDNRGEFSRLGFDGTMPTDAQIVAAIERDIAGYMDSNTDVQPVAHTYNYDRDALIASVRAEIARRMKERNE